MGANSEAPARAGQGRPTVARRWVLAAHQVDELARDHETESGAAASMRLGTGELGERREQLRKRGGVHADAGIDHAEFDACQSGLTQRGPS